MRPISISRFLAGSILCLAPWAFGGIERWAIEALEGLVAVAFILAGVHVWRKQVRETAWQWSWGGPMLALVVYIAIQAANASHRFQSADQNLIPQRHLFWLPHSADSELSWRALGLVLACCTLFWVVRLASVRTSFEKNVLGILAINGFLIAVFAMVQYVSGTKKIFWLRTPANHCDFLGPFVNPNNFAAYMNLLIPICLARGRLAQQARGSRIGEQPGFLFYFMAAVMFASVILSNSRAAVVIATILILSWIMLEFRRSKTAGQRAGFLLGSFVLLAGCVVLVLSFTGLGPTQHKLVSLTAPWNWNDQRFITYAATLQMFRDNWLFGVGAGAFPHAFPFYQPDSLNGFWQQAHNDWLQCLAELGVVGMTMMAAAWIGAFHTACGSPLKRREAIREALKRQPMAVAILLSLAGQGAHAAVDFPLHIPAILFLAVAFLAILSVQLARP